MLETLVHRKRDHVRLDTSPAGEFLEPFADALAEKRYHHSTIVRHVFAADRVSRWLQQRGQTVKELDDSIFAVYVRELGRRRRVGWPNGCLPATVAGACRFLAFLRQSGVTPMPILVPRTDAERWVASYDQHLERSAGLAAGTRRYYCRYWPYVELDIRPVSS